jgi:hypothetical protein
VPWNHFENQILCHNLTFHSRIPQYNTTYEAFHKFYFLKIKIKNKINKKQIKPRRKWHKMMSLHKMNQHRSATHNTNHNWVLSQDEEQ